jgi:hypothetical protein
MPKQMMRAREIIGEFVHSAPWGALWDAMVHDLIEPLDLKERFPCDNWSAFCKGAAANIRAHWPASWNDRQLWDRALHLGAKTPVS